MRSPIEDLELSSISLFFISFSFKISFSLLFSSAFIDPHIFLSFLSVFEIKKFISFPLSYLEKTEKLEQLRALENGMIIKVVKTKDHFIGVDTQKDLNKVRNKIKNQSESN